MEVKNICAKKRVRNISFKVYEGEVLGLTGLVGAGRTELLQAVFGVDKMNDGLVYIEDKLIKTINLSGGINKKQLLHVG